MANYRQVHCRMWSSDNWFIELKPDMKLFFIYLFTNERMTICGLYEIPVRIMSFETGLDREIIARGLEIFKKADKVEYDFETGVVWVKNAIKYQGQTNPSDMVLKRIKVDFEAIPDCSLKLECIDTLPIRYRQAVDTTVSVSVPVSEERGGVGEKTKNVFALYEESIGPLVPLIADSLKDAEETYSAAWVVDAIALAVENNKRNWRYCEAILKRWQRDGKDNGRRPPPNGTQDYEQALQKAGYK